jgi:uncharacterized protein
MTTWIAKTDAGVVIVRDSDAGFLVDRPAEGRFRTPCDNVDGLDLRPVVGLPADMDALTGWYSSIERSVLLTQFPEPYFGEPMVMLGEGRQVQRVYPVSETELITETGADITLTTDRLTLTTDTATTVLTKSDRYVEQQVTFTADGVQLAGTLIKPATAGPHPAAVVVHPAAGGQRDFCRLFVGPLLTAGVAVLIYDKAGHGRSEGSPPSIFDQAAAARAGFELLATLPDIDVLRRGLVGFSNGMWSVPMVAARRPEVAFVVGIGAPGVSMGESEVHRRTKVLRDAGVGPETVASVGEAWRCIFAIVGAGTASDEVSDRLSVALTAIGVADDLSRYETPDYVRENPMLSPIPPLVPVADLIAMVAAEPDAEVSYDPATDYATVRCPVFLQYGAHDTSVPVEVSSTRILAAAPGATIVVYPDLEHMLTVLPYGVTGLEPEAAMYGFHRFTFGDTVGRHLTSWLRESLVAV